MPTAEGVREMAGDTVREGSGRDGRRHSQRGERERWQETQSEGSGRQVAGGFAHRGKDYLLFQVKWESFRGILAEQ